MPFFNRSVADLRTADHAELLEEDAVENLRLEFKRDEDHRALDHGFGRAHGSGQKITPGVMSSSTRARTPAPWACQKVTGRPQ
jgi:hypothetical protein